MTTTFQPQSHKVVSYQHPITCVETLSVRFPALCPLLHNRPIERKVYPCELNVVDETAAVHSFGKEKTKTVTKERWWIFIIYRFSLVQEHFQVSVRAAPQYGGFSILETLVVGNNQVCFADIHYHLIIRSISFF